MNWILPKAKFNIAGPCIEGRHYIVPALERNKEVLPLAEEGHYFVIHAARQTGKTTLLKSLVRHMNKKGDFYALYCSLEALQGISDPEQGIKQIIEQLKKALFFEEIFAKEAFDKIPKDAGYTTLIYLAIGIFCKILQKPLVLLFDEVDCLSNEILIPFLRQLRDGYINRDQIPFAHSIALVGMRNIRDYKGKIRGNNSTLGSASPLNIMTESLIIKNFGKDEITYLFNQHKENTGQFTEKEALDRIFYWTNGQPWLVNAIGREVSEKILGKDFSAHINEQHIDIAAENLMLKRDTHIDSLLERLKEERVKRIIEPVIKGYEFDISILSDDTQYCIDLGLIKEQGKSLIPSNKIYAEVIIRTLSYDNQYALHSEIKNKWISGGQVNMSGLLKGFQQFWRENSEIWIEKYQYKEAAPHLILQAFLQRIINGGGTISREYATGKRRMDLCIHYGNNKYPIEIKLFYNQKTKEEGLLQLSDYMDKLGETLGWLVIFNRDNTKSWNEKIFWETKSIEKQKIHIVGC